jgi:phytoene dehydrogenase-like protein
VNYRYDAIVVGSGPNGLAAAITLAKAGLSVLVLEANETPGGGVKTEALTLPGFAHDVCSSIHPLAVASPFFRTLDLDVQWIFPEIDLAHPLGGDGAAWLNRSITSSAESLGKDAQSYRRLMEPLVAVWKPLIQEILQPMVHFPRHPWMLSKFGMLGLRSAGGLARSRFQGEAGRALFAGLAGHSFLQLQDSASAAIGLVLGILAHGVGWPMPRGGSGKITAGLISVLRASGGQIETGQRVLNVDQLSPARAVLFDVTPRQLLAIAGHRLPPGYAAALAKFRYGPGVFKVDYALNSPIPWSAAACRKAGTIHLGGTLEEIQLAEHQAATGTIPERPFVLVAQHSLLDHTRAPAGKHTAWAYCHVPHASTIDMTNRIEAQIERFAPGFRDCVLARAGENCRQLEEKNSNLVGGDINGGLANLRQLVARPILSPVPYRTPVKGWYLCSASTPPGGGVHGMCGYNAARDALKSVFGIAAG